MAEILKEGWLTKRALKSGRNWKKRYFTLRKDGSLTYKERKDDTKPKGEIQLGAGADVVRSDEEQFCFEITGDHRLVARAESQFEQKDWMVEISNAIAYASGQDPTKGPAKRFSFADDGLDDDVLDGESTGKVLNAGYLQKLGGGEGGTKNWNRRYFVLRDDLAYYTSEESFKSGERPKGRIKLEAYFVSQDENEDGFEFTVHSYPKSLTCQASSLQERNLWSSILMKSFVECADLVNDVYALH